MRLINKALRDLWAHRTQALFMVVALAAGLLSMGTIVAGQTVLTREMTRAYVDTVPASASLDLGGPVDLDTLQRVRHHPAVSAAERQGVVHTTWRWPNGPQGRALLFVRDDLEHVEMNKMWLEEGTLPKAAGEVVIEREAARFSGATVGDTIELGGSPIRITGIVHDPALPPAASEQAIYVFGTPATISEIPSALDHISIRVASDRVEELDVLVADVARGLPTLHRIDIPPPGRHPHQGPSDAVLTLFTVFGASTFALSIVVARSLLETILVRESRQIAVLRTLGATRRQIRAIYLSMMLCVASISTGISLALLSVSARPLIHTIAALLNFDILDPAIPGRVWGGLALVGVVLPALLALPAIRRAADRDVVATIRDYGTPLAIQPPRLVFGSRVLAVGVGNALRNRRRLILTVTMMAAAGGLFVAAQSVSDAWGAITGRVLLDRDYALEVTVDRGLSQVPAPLELWGEAPGTVDFVGELPISRTYPDGGHGTFKLVGSPTVPATETFLIRQGRWHEADSEVVLNQTAARDLGYPTLGSEVLIAVEDARLRLKVVGLVEVVAAPSSAYVSTGTFQSHGLPLSVIRSPRDTGPLERVLKKENLGVERRLPVQLVFNAMGEHVAVVVAALQMIAMLMGIVGSIALSSTLAISVLERRRELAVLRAIGARRLQLTTLLVTEGMVMAALALPLVVVVAVPAAGLLGAVVGWMAFQIPLPLDLSWSALLGWSLGSLLFAAGASVVPALGSLNDAVCDGLRDA